MCVEINIVTKCSLPAIPIPFEQAKPQMSYNVLVTLQYVSYSIIPTICIYYSVQLWPITLRSNFARGFRLF